MPLRRCVLSLVGLQQGSLTSLFAYQLAMESSYRNTLTFVVSGAMVMGSLQAAAARQPAAQFGDACQGKLQQLTPAGGAVVDDASPLSSSSRFVALQTASSITPTSVLTAPPVTDHQQQQQLCHLLGVQRQQQEAQKHQLQLPQQRQQPAALQSRTQGSLQGAAGAVQQQGPSKWAWQQQQQQPLLAQQQQQQQHQVLLTQSSGGSFSSATSNLRTSLPGSSGDSFTSGASAVNANSMAWQQLLKHQQLQLVQQQHPQVQQVQQVQLIPAVHTLPTNNAGSALGKRLAAPSGYDQYPVAKKAATSTAVAAMLQASLTKPAWPGAPAQQQAYQQPQQQLVLLQVPNRQQQAQNWQQLRAQLPPTGLLRQRQQQPLRGASSGNLALVPAGGAAAAVPAPAPMRVLEPAQQKLLHWAGRVLNCQLQDAYLLGSHLYRRVTGQLDDMLLISLGVTASTESVTMLVSLWVASKLEGHRRQVAGASKLAAALQLLPASITDIELHVMQRLQWQPYAGWAGRLLE